VSKKTETERQTVAEKLRKEELETVGSRSAEEQERHDQRMEEGQR